MIACLTHWYTSALYFTPVGVLGGVVVVSDRVHKRRNPKAPTRPRNAREVRR